MATDATANTATGQPANEIIPVDVPTRGDTDNVISNGDLPWGIVIMPTTSAGHSGMGDSKHGLQPETWVIGYFLDGDDCQQPVITGVIAGGPGGGTGFNNYSPSTQPSTDPNSPDTPVVAGGNNVETAFNFLVKSGYTAAQAAGIIGNLQAESGGNVNPGAYNPNDRGKPSFGIAQWRAERKDSMIAFAKARGQSPDSLEVQLQYLVHELRNVPEHSFAAERLLRNSNNPRDAAIAFMNFERPQEGYSEQRRRMTGGNGVDPNNANTRKRINYALGVYESMKSKGLQAANKPATEYKIPEGV